MCKDTPTMRKDTAIVNAKGPLRKAVVVVHTSHGGKPPQSVMCACASGCAGDQVSAVLFCTAESHPAA
jgi:hypothetical protein